MVKRLAIIPARLGSKRLPRKNIKRFFGRPLLHYTLDCAKNTELFDTIHVSTESEEVADLAGELGCRPPFLRPADLASDTATLTQVCENVIKEYEARGEFFDTFCILWATAPLRSSQDVCVASTMLTDEIDGVVAVTEYSLPVYCAQSIDDNMNLTPVFPDLIRAPASVMSRVVCDNGAFCWVRVSSFKEHGTWLPPRLKGYEMPRDRSPDIDTEADWEWAAFLFDKQG
ncbi:MAG: acylneuraminate cytidylyltransferase family protein [Burkholderiales bacterium]|nr:acylneuraminate cytidylyltransferase family protein [Burkholderiales bacterium]